MFWGFCKFELLTVYKCGLLKWQISVADRELTSDTLELSVCFQYEADDQRWHFSNIFCPPHQILQYFFLDLKNTIHSPVSETVVYLSLVEYNTENGNGFFNVFFPNIFFQKYFPVQLFIGTHTQRWLPSIFTIRNSISTSICLRMGTRHPFRLWLKWNDLFIRRLLHDHS